MIHCAAIPICQISKDAFFFEKDANMEKLQKVANYNKNLLDHKKMTRNLDHI